MDRINFVKQTRSFTLVELLIVLSVVAILLALIFPALERVKISSNRIKCLSNLRQIGMVASTYSTEHDMYAAPSAFYVIFSPYTPLNKYGLGYVPQDSTVWICPADQRTVKYNGIGNSLSYGINGTQVGISTATFWSTTKKMLTIANPEKTIYFCDSRVYYVGNPSWPYAEFRHGTNSINALFFDYHAESLTYTNTADFYKLF